MLIITLSTQNKAVWRVTAGLIIVLTLMITPSTWIRKSTGFQDVALSMLTSIACGMNATAAVLGMIYTGLQYKVPTIVLTVLALSIWTLQSILNILIIYYAGD